MLHNTDQKFPIMPPDAIQDSWTGSHGETLLSQSVPAMQSMISGYEALTGKSIRAASVLDYGCGWGRLIRLLYTFVPADQIYGVDPWDESIELCERYGVRCHLALCDYVPRALPFDRSFDLIYAFSVFTHLSEKTARAVLSTLRRYIQPDGVLVITIRPRDYWIHQKYEFVAIDRMLEAHDTIGFAFTPHNREPIDGDISYGETSISLSYIENTFTDWRIAKTEYVAADPFQFQVFLRPA